jgi:hypothetical protein
MRIPPMRTEPRSPAGRPCGSAPGRGASRPSRARQRFRPSPERCRRAQGGRSPDRRNRTRCRPHSRGRTTALAAVASALRAPSRASPSSRRGERMLGTSLHYLGDQSNALRHLEHVGWGAPAVFLDGGWPPCRGRRGSGGVSPSMAVQAPWPTVVVRSRLDFFSSYGRTAPVRRGRIRGPVHVGNARATA